MIESYEVHSLLHAAIVSSVWGCMLIAEVRRVDSSRLGTIKILYHSFICRSKATYFLCFTVKLQVAMRQIHTYNSSRLGPIKILYHSFVCRSKATFFLCFTVKLQVAMRQIHTYIHRFCMHKGKWIGPVLRGV